MYSVTVRDHMMIAHSFQRRGVRSGAAAARRDLRRRRRVPPARARRRRHRGRHRPRDRGAATALLAGLNYRNLDEEPAFDGTQHDDRVSGARRLRPDRRRRSRAAISGRRRARIESVRVTLHESHVASAGYEGAWRGSLTALTTVPIARASSSRATRHANRRLRLRPADHRRPARRGWDVDVQCARRQLSASDAAARAARARDVLARAIPDGTTRRSSTAWRSARCRTKPSAEAAARLRLGRARASSAGAARPARRATRQRARRRASGARSRPCAASS